MVRTSLCFGAAVLIIVAVFATPLALLARVYLATAFVIMNLLLNIAAPLFIVCGLPPRYRGEGAGARAVGLARRSALADPVVCSQASTTRPSAAQPSARWRRRAGSSAACCSLCRSIRPLARITLKSVPPGVLYLFGIAILASVLGLRLPRYSRGTTAITSPPGIRSVFSIPCRPVETRSRGRPTDRRLHAVAGNLLCLFMVRDAAVFPNVSRRTLTGLAKGPACLSEITEFVLTAVVENNFCRISVACDTNRDGFLLLRLCRPRRDSFAGAGKSLDRGKKQDMNTTKISLFAGAAVVVAVGLVLAIRTNPPTSTRDGAGTIAAP